MDLSASNFKINFDDESSTGTFGVSSSLTQNHILDMQITPGTPKIRNSDLGSKTIILSSPVNAPSIKWGCFGTIKCPTGYHFIEEVFARFLKSTW